ncbi:TonB-dependent receptor plug domain-containing protein [Tsuneonella sp. HG094]
MSVRFPQSSLLVLALVAGPVLAQEAPAPTAQAESAAPADEGSASDNEIVVTAARIPGQVETAVPPIVELDEQQVAAYGATSISDLVAQLAPQIGSGRGRGGRPVFLLNGQRISSFREMGRLPPEAIRKVEVLPEEVAVQFGYPADQRVINFILKDDFVSREVEVEYGQPWAGGYSSQEGELGLLTIDGKKRFNGTLSYNRRTPLTEAERGVIQATGNAPTVATDADPAAFRTLVGRNSTFEANVTRSSGFGEGAGGGTFTLNGNYTHENSTSLSGLDTVLLTGPTGSTAVRTIDADPLFRRSNSDTYSLGGGVNMPLGDWQFSSTVDASLADIETLIDRRRDTTALRNAATAGTLPIDGALPTIGDAGIDTANSRTWNASNKTTLVGRPFSLPGGEVGLTFDAGYDWTRIESTDTRSVTGNPTLTRGNLNGGVNLNLPITSTREGFGEALGDLSLNLSGGVDYLSDFGTLTDWSTGLNWRPTERLGLQASYTVREAAPGLSQLGGPQLVTFNVPTYDFQTGQTVLITTTTGGNPNLLAETQRDLKLAANYDIDLFERANVVVEYYRNRSDNVTSSFPLLTPAIEAAFPGRVTRAADGTLLAIDSRPVTFAQTKSDRIRYGFNLFGKVGKASPESAGSGSRSARFGGAAAAAPAPTPAPAPSTPRVTTGGFDPARFAEMRTKFCGTPEGQVPDLSGIPERMLERLKGPDGQVDPAKVAEMKTRFCSADGAPGGPRRFDPAEFAALRTALQCADPTKPIDIATLPPQIADRLKGPDGSIDQARLKELQTRLCAVQVPAQGAQGSGRGQGGERGPAGGGGPGGGGRGPGGPGGGMMGMMGGRGGDGQGRWNLSAYHTINLGNSVLIAPGVPELDLLNGDATGSSGVSKHQVTLEGGVFYKGIGARLSGNYASGTTVNGSGLPGSSDLRFHDLATFNVRMFMALDQQKWLTGGGEDAGFWKGARLGLAINNVFDAQQRVTDETGTVPLRYQPALVDPTGRFIELEFRKVF